MDRAPPPPGAPPVEDPPPLFAMPPAWGCHGPAGPGNIYIYIICASRSSRLAKMLVLKASDS